MWRRTIPGPFVDLGGKRALVTGASRGIGRAIAEALAAAGADVAVTARDAAALAPIVAAIAARGGKVAPLALELRDIGQCRAAVAAAAAALGGLDILVNNAGMEQVAPSLEVEEAAWDAILDTNLKGAFFCAQAAARRMRAEGHGGVIINLCSLASAVGIPTAVPYGASKSGLLGVTRGLAAEWAPLGIRVNAIVPGYFRTAMTEPFFADPDWQRAMLEKIPLGRFGENRRPCRHRRVPRLGGLGLCHGAGLRDRWRLSRLGLEAGGRLRRAASANRVAPLRSRKMPMPDISFHRLAQMSEGPSRPADAAHADRPLGLHREGASDHRGGEGGGRRGAQAFRPASSTAPRSRASSGFRQPSSMPPSPRWSPR